MNHDQKNIQRSTLNFRRSRKAACTLSPCSSFVPRPRFVGFDYKDGNEGRARFERAFTLIELLVVIGIIAILAAMVMAGAGGVMRKALVKRVQGELAQVDTAINRYKTDRGFYPPDNKVGNNPALPYPNSLYYELVGANYDRGRNEFTTLGGGEVVSADELNDVFNTRGINNAVISGNNDGVTAKNYLPDIKPNQHGPGPRGLQILGAEVEGRTMVGEISPFLYVSSNPTNNPSTFDLWVDIIVGSDTKRISNWSDEPVTVSD
jgi:prepilin-type N-terminal cleavage/methylation domain-containing protein